MNDLLFYTTLILIALYFFYYLPQSSKTSPTHSNSKLAPTIFSTVSEPKTEVIPDPEIITKLESEISTLKLDQTQKEQTIIGLNASYEKLEKQMKQQNQTSAQTINGLKSQITTLQSQIRDLAKRPLKPTHSKGTQTDELTNTLDTLIKDIQELNNSL